MPVIVNGYELSDAEMEQELPQHEGASDPLKSAMTALVLRRVLLDKANEYGFSGDDEQKVESLLGQALKVPHPTEDECKRYFDLHQSRFLVGELVEANHILFQVTPNVDLDALRQRAQAVLEELNTQPEVFAECAKKYSNCPSAEVGGNLGQLSRGETVPEFEKVIFSAAAHSLIPRIVETRFGLHIVQLGRKVAGRLMPFEQVKNQIADAMQRASYDRALQQYMKVLVGQAQISGVDLEGAESPLVQ